MSTGHAVSGVTVWLTGWAIASSTGVAQPGLDVIVVGSLLCAGGALYPDIDHPNSRVTKCGGFLTRWVAAAHAHVGRHVHAVTRLDADRPDLDGHRTVSHTFVFALMVWMTTAALVADLGPAALNAMVESAGGVDGRWDRALHTSYGPVVAAAVVWFFTNVGAAAAFDVLAWRHQRVTVARLLLLTRKARRKLPSFLRYRKVRWSTLVGLFCAGTTYALVPGTTWWIAVAVAAGCAVHCLGDAITASGCPILWPIPIPSTELRYVRGQGRVPTRVWRTWYLVGTPRSIRFRVGSPTETVVTWTLAILGAIAAIALAAAAG